MFSPARQVSIHGRRVGLNSTGALYLQDTAGVMYAAVAVSTAGALAFSSGVSLQSFVESTVASSAASTLPSFGMTHLVGAAAVVDFQIEAPTAGIPKTIRIDSSSTLVRFGGITTDVVFASTRATANGSTLVAARTGGLSGVVISLVGVSTAEWMITGSTATLSVG